MVFFQEAVFVGPGLRGVAGVVAALVDGRGFVTHVQVQRRGVVGFRVLVWRQFLVSAPLVEVGPVGRLVVVKRKFDLARQTLVSDHHRLSCFH